MLLFTLLYTGVSLQKWFFGLSYTRYTHLETEVASTHGFTMSALSAVKTKFFLKLKWLQKSVCCLRLRQNQFHQMRFRTRQRVPTVDSCSAGAGVKAGVGVAAATTTLVNADFTLYCCLSTQFQCIFGMGGTHSSARPVTP